MASLSAGDTKPPEPLPIIGGARLARLLVVSHRRRYRTVPGSLDAVLFMPRQGLPAGRGTEPRHCQVFDELRAMPRNEQLAGREF